MVHAVADVRRLYSKSVGMIEAFLSLTVGKTVEPGSTFDMRAR
jgi:hypothetical protein